jgi:hypothetical protein
MRAPGSCPSEVCVSESDRRREDDWFLRNEGKLLASARLAREKREQERRGFLRRVLGI